MKVYRPIGSIGQIHYPDRDTADRRKQKQESEHQREKQAEQGEETDSEPSQPLTLEDLNRAVEVFQSDTNTINNGLTAMIEGTGPGLTVILKDREGSVVRQFSSEEFLRLSGSSLKDFKPRGKILDQKL